MEYVRIAILCKLQSVASVRLSALLTVTLCHIRMKNCTIISYQILSIQLYHNKRCLTRLQDLTQVETTSMNID